MSIWIETIGCVAVKNKLKIEKLKLKNWRKNDIRDWNFWDTALYIVDIISNYKLEVRINKKTVMSLLKNINEIW